MTQKLCKHLEQCVELPQEWGSETNSADSSEHAPKQYL